MHAALALLCVALIVAWVFAMFSVFETACDYVWPEIKRHFYNQKSLYLAKVTFVSGLLLVPIVAIFLVFWFIVSLPYLILGEEQ